MFANELKDHLECMARLEKLEATVQKAGELLANGLQRGGKVLVCGNGGSAADAQHFAAELIGRFETERPPWPAIALSTDTSILTAVGNDYGYAQVFSRQVEGLGQPGDVLIGISTSGKSANISHAVTAARDRRMQTIGLLGCDGGALRSEVDHAIVVPEVSTARVQEAHIFILHFWAGFIEGRLT
ncbi:MAG: D-sedoheptulose 7-phosphate isomerase [Desulfobacteraceae bacterium]